MRRPTSGTLTQSLRATPLPSDTNTATTPTQSRLRSRRRLTGPEDAAGWLEDAEDEEGLTGAEELGQGAPITASAGSGSSLQPPESTGEADVLDMLDPAGG